MYRRRLNPQPSQSELERLYAEPHDARRYGYGHHLRVEASKVLGRWMAVDHEVRSVADLSTGNAEIVDSLPPSVTDVYLGDFAAGYEFHGPIERTIYEIPEVDLFVCSETIEHLDEPEVVLEAIRGKARLLFLSTPIGEEHGDWNPEHLWGWDQEAVQKMLTETGWRTLVQVDLNLIDTTPYQLWSLEAA